MNILKNTKAFLITDLSETRFLKRHNDNFTETSEIDQAIQFISWNEASAILNHFHHIVSARSPLRELQYILPITILITGDE